MSNIIQIKRSATTATPPTLAVGEVAYSSLSGNLFIGEAGSVITKIGGNTDVLKLAGIADGANNYVHPVSHPPAIITQDSTNRFVTDAEKTTWNAKIASSEKGAANGVCPLGADSLISTTYLPSYVDDVLEYANLAAFPASGESGKIYVAIDTLKTYRWSGTVYAEIASGTNQTITLSGDVSGSGTTAITVALADAGVTAALLTGYTSGANTALAATDSILEAMGKIQGQIAARAPLVSPSFTTPALGVATGTSFNSITGLSSTSPAALGTAAVGTGVTVARADHVHAMPTLDALSNTTITSNATGEILKWNGSAWINNTLAEAGIQATLTDAAVTAKLLTGYVVGANTALAATDSILAAMGKIQGQINVKANLISPAFTTPNIGVATGTSFNSITGLASVAAVMNGTAAVGVSTLAARQDHVHPSDTNMTIDGGSF